MSDFIMLSGLTSADKIINYLTAPVIVFHIHPDYFIDRLLTAAGTVNPGAYQFDKKVVKGIALKLTVHKGHSEWSIYDLGGFGMSLMLAAKDLGVDSVVAYELTKYPDVLRKYVNIPDTEDIAIGIAFGYESDDIVNKFRAKKQTLEEVCHFVK